MKFNYTLVLTTLFALSVSATEDQECKYALKNLGELLEFPAIDAPSSLNPNPSYDETVQTLDQLNKDLEDITVSISSKCSGLAKDIKGDQFFRLDYLKSLESAKDVYINIWGSSEAINSDPELLESTLSVVDGLDKVLDFAYNWRGTSKDNAYKRLTNDLLRLRDRTKAALE